MKTNKIFLIISREFLIRVKKKSFIFTTLLTPLLFAALIALPSVIMMFSSDDDKQKILVVDRTGICEPYFKSNEKRVFEFNPTADVEAIKKNFDKENIYAVIEVKSIDSSMNMAVTAYSSKQMNIDTKESIEKSVQKAAENAKLKKYKIDNLDKILKDVRSEVNVKTFTLGEEGDEKLGMVEIYMGIAYICSFMIYMFIFMFGSMVMRGVIEEKTNRIIEVIVSSVKPFELMLGKIIGVGSVALVQFLIWIALTVGITFGIQAAFGVDKLTGNSQITQQVMQQGVAGQQVAVPEISSPMGDVMTALAGVDFVSIISAFLIYFLLGYFLYAAMFSAVGSAVDNEADTQQLILPVTLPLIIGLFIMIHTFQYPDSSLSFWGSMIPFTSPMVMMARVPFGVPMWELALSITLLIATFLFMTYVSSKIYRVGILMYGKKATWKDLIKWLKY